MEKTDMYVCVCVCVCVCIYLCDYKGTKDNVFALPAVAAPIQGWIMFVNKLQTNCKQMKWNANKTTTSQLKLRSCICLISTVYI